MENKKAVIYIPFWIAGMLERNNLPLSTVMDYRKMSHYVSAQEQANMLLFQNVDPFACKLQDGQGGPQFDVTVARFGTHITEGRDYSPLSAAWHRSVVNSADANDNKLRQNLDNLDSLSYAQSTADEVAMRFNPENGVRVAHTHPFITYDVEREFLIVVLYPAFYDYAHFTDTVFALCKAVLKVLYVYNTPAVGCKTPYFRKYLESLV